jgi:hypothetical protein
MIIWRRDYVDSNVVVGEWTLAAANAGRHWREELFSFIRSGH